MKNIFSKAARVQSPEERLFRTLNKLSLACRSLEKREDRPRTKRLLDKSYKAICMSGLGIEPKHDVEAIYDTIIRLNQFIDPFYTSYKNGVGVAKGIHYITEECQKMEQEGKNMTFILSRLQNLEHAVDEFYKQNPPALFDRACDAWLRKFK